VWKSTNEAASYGLDSTLTKVRGGTGIFEKRGKDGGGHFVRAVNIESITSLRLRGETEEEIKKKNKKKG